MPNFEAQVRTTYRDVAGLVLSCVREDVVVVERNNLKFVREWINRAPGMPSQPAIRQPGDPAPTYLGGRFSNPIQKTQALQPTRAETVGGDNRVQFDRARSTFLATDFLVDDLPAPPGQPLAVGYQFTKGGDASNDQTILVDAPDEEFKVQRRNAAGDAEIDADGDLTTVAGDHDDGTFVYTGRSDSTSTWQKDGGAYGSGAGDPLNEFGSSSQLFLGRDVGGNYLDGTLDAIHVWVGELSPKTIDLIWQTINEDGNDFSTDARADMGNIVWADLTADALIDQYDRLRPQTGFPHRYIKVTLPAAPATRKVQVACAVNGLVLPDSKLGAELFTYTFAEVPGPPFIPPVSTPEASWSAVIDFDLVREGHYTLVCTRLNGGSVVLHFDVQVGP